MSEERIVHQPLHPTIKARLDPEYLEFHESTLKYLPVAHHLPWSPSIRNAPAVPGMSAPLKVAKTEDYDLTHTKFRAFTPEGEPPASGWPAFIFFHGGGWTLGNIGSENSFATNMAARANCVVLSVDYRLAPENPYPAAVEDAVESLEWVHREGKSVLSIDTSKIAVGGSSSGGNLAAVVALKAAERGNIPVIFQLLVVPVTDNTATEATLWKENKNTCWLSPGRMNWFKGNYLPNSQDWTKWDASPYFAPAELVKKLPGAWIGVAELDILAPDGIAYGERLKKEGVKVEIVVYKGAPHPIMAMDDRLKIGAQLVTDAATALKNALYT